MNIDTRRQMTWEEECVEWEAIKNELIKAANGAPVTGGDWTVYREQETSR